MTSRRIPGLGGDHTESPGARAASPQVGLVLLFGMVFLGAALVFLTGSIALDAVEQQSTNEQLEQEMQQLRNDIETAQLGGQTTVEDVEVVTEGTITLTINGKSTKSMDMGSMHKSEGGTTHAYQAGGIWRQTDSGSRLVSEPQISHTKTPVETGEEIWTIELPPFEIESVDGTESGDMSVSYANRGTKQELLEGLDEDERVETLTIEIEDSPYHDAWYRFLQSELGGPSTVDHDPDDRTVKATNVPLGTIEKTDHTDPNWIVQLLDEGTIDPPAGVYSSAESMKLQQVYVDSYDSSTGPYDQSARTNGTIMASGDVDLQAGTTVDGTVFAGGTVDIRSGHTEVTGPPPTEGWDGYHEPDDMTATLSEIVSGVRSAHDTSPAIEEPDVDGGTTELDDGVYYLDSGTVSGDLTLDVSDGHVVVVVDDELTIDGDVTVEGVDSGYEAHWITTDRITIGDEGSVTVAGDRAPQHWFHTLASDESSIEGETFTGVLYTPGTSIDINGNGIEVYGGLVGDVEVRGTGAHNRVSFDEDLAPRDANITTEDGTATSHQDFDATVTFLDSDFATPPARVGSFPVDRELTTVENPDDDLDSIGFWQTASSGADDHAGGFTQAASSVTGGGGWFGCGWYTSCSDDQELHGLAGDEVTVNVETDEGVDTDVTLSGHGLSETGSDTEPIVAELPETGSYSLEIETDSETEYDVEVETSRSEYTYEEVEYEGTQYDTVVLETSAADTDYVVEVLDPQGRVIAIDEATGTNTLTYDGNALGTHTIRVSSSGSEPFEYDLTLKRTRIQEGANVMRQSPIEATMIFEQEDGAQITEPMTPDTDLEAESDRNMQPRWENDMNHPAVDYPNTYEFEDLPANTTFTVEVSYREQACSRSSFAGTSRTPEGTPYENDPIFELGCGEGAGGNFQENVNAIELLEEEAYDDEQFHRVRALEDGDPVPPIQPIEGQRTLQDMLGPYLRNSETGETEYELDLQPTERMFVFELAGHAYEGCNRNQYDPKSWGWQCGLDHEDDVPSYNDVVVLFEIEPTESEGNGDGDGDAPTIRPPDAETDEDYRYAIQMDGGVITVEGD
ncbi:hypothetical protein ACFO5R_15700 [Halosolutus amylolyticus]|uniref:DUF7305 domain-containing protein n=1 Tax=Halosolutus amylolyticus TaxID=2932267 RepID=A0ABD5PTU9_9EURY|nr:hypothetical protein [Halosolutus amylolyticus]